MIHHQISTISVFATDQYKNFTMMLGNRPLNMGKINKIIKQIESGNDMLPYYPIQVRVVDDLLQILDGQHRFYICKKLKKLVHYIIVSENKSMADIARVNSNVEKWNSQNFINCYIANDNEDYKVLHTFMDKYSFGALVSISLLTTGNPTTHKGSTEFSNFQEGSFKVKEYDKAIELAEACSKF